jgi:hypothetical protein
MLYLPFFETTSIGPYWHPDNCDRHRPQDYHAEATGRRLENGNEMTGNLSHRRSDFPMA